MGEERIIDTETLDGLIAHLKHYMAPAPGHVCGGPDSMCDCSCEEFARDCELLHKAKRARAATVPQPSRERAGNLFALIADLAEIKSGTHAHNALQELCAMASQAPAKVKWRFVYDRHLPMEDSHFEYGPWNDGNPPAYEDWPKHPFPFKVETAPAEDAAVLIRRFVACTHLDEGGSGEPGYEDSDAYVGGVMGKEDFRKVYKEMAVLASQAPAVDSANTPIQSDIHEAHLRNAYSPTAILTARQKGRNIFDPFAMVWVRWCAAPGGQFGWRPIKQIEPLSRSDDHVRAHVDESLGYRASSQAPANPPETPDSSIEDEYEVIHYPTKEGGCVISVDGQGMLPCSKPEHNPHPNPPPVEKPDAAMEEAKKCGLRITYCRSFQVAATQEQAEKMAKALRDNPDATKEELDVIMNEIMGVNERAKDE